VASTSFWDAFADGYTSRRALSEVDLAAIGAGLRKAAGELL
jgi:hypothetical protein